MAPFCALVHGNVCMFPNDTATATHARCDLGEQAGLAADGAVAARWCHLGDRLIPQNKPAVKFDALLRDRRDKFDAVHWLPGWYGCRLWRHLARESDGIAVTEIAVEGIFLCADVHVNSVIRGAPLPAPRHWTEDDGLGLDVVLVFKVINIVAIGVVAED